MKNLIFAIPFEERSINAAFLQSFGRMSEIFYSDNVELIFMETGQSFAETGQQAIQELVTFIDGIIIPGNPHSLDPAWYGATTLHPEKVDPNPENFLFLKELVTKSIRRGIPVLGLCAGSWAVNVALGGSLEEEIKEAFPITHSRDPRAGSIAHTISVYDDSFLSNIIKSKTISVNSWHSSATKEVAPGMKVAAIAPDGVIEAIEGEREPFLFGIQFHPEYLESGQFLSDSEIEQQMQIFHVMSEVARQYARKRDLNKDLTIFSSLPDTHVLSKYQKNTAEILQRNLRPDIHHSWCELVQLAIQRLLSNAEKSACADPFQAETSHNLGNYC